jgi:hypothetical protein
MTAPGQTVVTINAPNDGGGRRCAVTLVETSSLVRFRGARVTRYVPLLVERAVLRRLRVLPAATEGAER